LNTFPSGKEIPGFHAADWAYRSPLGKSSILEGAKLYFPGTQLSRPCRNEKQ